ncbi:unnamed protein product [Prunus armeniaca]
MLFSTVLSYLGASLLQSCVVLIFEVRFNLDRRNVESSTGLGVVDLQKSGSSVTRSPYRRRDGRSKCQASGIGVVLAEGSLMLKSASVGQLPHWRKVSSVIEIMMVSLVFKDSQKCLTFDRLWVVPQVCKLRVASARSKSPCWEEIESNSHEDDVGTDVENVESKYLEECSIEKNKVVVCAGEATCDLVLALPYTPESGSNNQVRGSISGKVNVASTSAGVEVDGVVYAGEAWAREYPNLVTLGNFLNSGLLQGMAGIINGTTKVMYLPKVVQIDEADK